MSDTKESFDYQGVQNKMESLEKKFDEFSSILEQTSEKVFSEINGPMSAIFGETATMLKTTWDDNAITFGDFRRNFDTWAQLVAQISINNLEFESDVMEQFRTLGTGTSVLRSDGQVVQMTDIIDETYAGQVVVDEAFGGKVVTQTNVDGSISKIHYNSNNEITYIENISSDGFITTIRNDCITVGTETGLEYQYNGWCKVFDENSGKWTFYQIGENNERIPVEEAVFNEGIANDDAKLNSFASDGEYSDILTYDPSQYADLMDPTSEKAEITPATVVDNDSIISDGESYTMSADSTLKLADGQTYKFVGLSTDGDLIVKRGDVEYKIEEGIPVISENHTIADTTIFDVYSKDDGFIVTDIVTDNSANIAYSTDYIREGGMEQSTSDYAVNISSGDIDGDGEVYGSVYDPDSNSYVYEQSANSDVSNEIENAVTSQKTMIASEGEHFVDYDYDDQDFSDILYNQSVDAGDGYVTDIYYSDANSDNWISTSSESLNDINDGSQDAVNKIVEDGDNMKDVNWIGPGTYLHVQKDGE